MKILITEKQFEGLLVLLEEKNQKIIDKLVNFGLSEKTSIELTKIAGKISIFLVFKLLAMFETMWDMNNMTREEKFKKAEPQFIFYRDKIQSIVDWFRVGLNGNIKPYENLSFNELYEKSVEWHNSLEIGDDKIDFIEKNKIILDFRKNGVGFYWVDLATSLCTDEAKRMGHCGSSSGNLYSLREYKKIGDGHTANKSHLTLSLSDDGDILQLKGPKNSKPRESVHKYIVPLFYHAKEDGDYLINGFDYEYSSDDDFSLLDLDKSEIEKLYKLRPSFFDKKTNKLVLISKGVIEKPNDFYVFDYSIYKSDIKNYVKGGWNVDRSVTGRKIDIFEALLSGDFRYDSDVDDWVTPLQYYLNVRNKERIETILKYSAKREQVQFDYDLSTKEMIEEYDFNDVIKNILVYAYNQEAAKAVSVYYMETLKKCLEKYGTILDYDDSDVQIRIDLERFNIDNLEKYIIDYDDLDDIFNVLIHENRIKKPKFEIDKNWLPEIDDKSFNKLVADELHRYLMI